MIRSLITLDISIHTLRVEGDYVRAHSLAYILAFQSTPSAWRVTMVGRMADRILRISIHTLRVEGDEVKLIGYTVPVISIHTLRVEGDLTS